MSNVKAVNRQGQPTWRIRERLAQARSVIGRLGRKAPARLAVLAFVALIGVLSLVLCSPWATASGHSANPIDAIFTATSAICVTGLTTVPTATFWSTFGQAAILVGIQIGGLGIMTLGALLSLITSRRLGLTQRLLAAEETGSSRIGDVGLLARAVGISSAFFEVVLAIILIPRIAASGESWGTAIWHGVFYAVSTFNNAGFVPTSQGLAPYASDWLVLVPIAIGVFIGSLGFPVILNLARNLRRPSRWSLHTKMTLAGSAVLGVVGPVLIGAMEWFNPKTLGAAPVSDRVLGAIFAGTMPRSGGFATVKLTDMHESTLLAQDALMFIGGGSGSTAGGIKVTTLMVMLIAIVAETRGDRDMEAFGRRIPPGVLRVAVTVAVVSFAAVFVATLALLTVSQAPLDEVLFESISAYATCGLTTGLSATLPAGGKLIIACLMLLGRLGTMTLAAALTLRNRRRLIRLPNERPIVG